MVDHENRNAVAKGNHQDDHTFPPVEGKINVFVYNINCVQYNGSFLQILAKQEKAFVNRFFELFKNCISDRFL